MKTNLPPMAHFLRKAPTYYGRPYVFPPVGVAVASFPSWTRLEISSSIKRAVELANDINCKCFEVLYFGHYSDWEIPVKNLSKS